MITSFKLFESDESGFFSVGGVVYYLRYSDKIYIMLDDEIYQELSIEIPDTKQLENSGFFMNPEVNQDIINILIDENFIEETNKKSIAGDKEVKSYRVI